MTGVRFKANRSGIHYFTRKFMIRRFILIKKRDLITYYTGRGTTTSTGT